MFYSLKHLWNEAPVSAFCISQDVFHSREVFRTSLWHEKGFFPHYAGMICAVNSWHVLDGRLATLQVWLQPIIAARHYGGGSLNSQWGLQKESQETCHRSEKMHTILTCLTFVLRLCLTTRPVLHVWRVRRWKFVSYQKIRSQSGWRCVIWSQHYYITYREGNKRDPSGGMRFYSWSDVCDEELVSWTKKIITING